MRTPVFTRKFDKEVKLQQRRGKDMEKLSAVLRALTAGEALSPIHREHRLAGNWQGRNECHIESDWLLIYKIESDRIILERTGSHADLFKK